MPSYNYTNPQGQSFTLDVDEELHPDQVYQRFVDAGVAQAQAPQATTDAGYLSQLGSALSIGAGQMASGVKATFNAATGDIPDTAAAMAQMGALQKEQQANLSAEDIALNEAFARNKAEYDQARGILPTIGALGGYVGSIASQPGAAFKQAIQSAPNAAISAGTGLAGYALGGLLGAGAGIETGPGAVLTGIAGAAAGGAISNSLMEAGPAIYDILNERTNGAASSMTADQITQVLQQNPDIMSEGLKTGAIRGSVIGVIEGLGMKGAGRLMSIPERAAARAVQKTLIGAGVDVASKEAVESALLDPALKNAVSAAAKTAQNEFTSAGNLARLAGASGIEIGASGAGEVGAQVATGQEIDPTAAVQEMMGEVGLSIPVAAVAKGLELARTPQALQTPIQQALAREINAIPTNAVPPQTEEEKRAGAEAGNPILVDPQGNTAAVAPEIWNEAIKRQITPPVEAQAATQPSDVEARLANLMRNPGLTAAVNTADSIVTTAENTSSDVSQATTAARNIIQGVVDTPQPQVVPTELPAVTPSPAMEQTENLSQTITDSNGEIAPEMSVLPPTAEAGAGVGEAIAEDGQLEPSTSIEDQKEALKDIIALKKGRGQDVAELESKLQSLGADTIPDFVEVNPETPLHPFTSEKPLLPIKVEVSDAGVRSIDSSVKQIEKLRKSLNGKLARASGANKFSIESDIYAADKALQELGRVGREIESYLKPITPQGTPTLATKGTVMPRGSAIERETDEQKFQRIKSVSPSQRTDEDIAFANAFSKRQKELKPQAGEATRKAFLANHTASIGGRLRKALDQTITFRGLKGTVGSWAEILYNEGWRMALDARGNRQFTNGTEALGSSGLGKIGMNYADFLSSQPQTTTVAAPTETAAPSAKEAAVASVVQQPVEGSIPTVEQESPVTAIESTEKTDVAKEAMRFLEADLTDTQRAKWTPEMFTAAQAFFDSGGKDFDSLKKAIKFPRVVQQAYLKADKEAAAEQTRREAADAAMAREVEKAEKEQAKLEADQKQREELGLKTLNSLIEKTRTNVVQGTVKSSDANQAVAILNKSGAIPNVLFTWIGTSKDFLADPANRARYPETWRAVSNNNNAEGWSENGQPIVFTDNVGVSDLDRNLAKLQGTTPEVAAVRRVILHENIHKGMFFLNRKDKMNLFEFLHRLYSPEELDQLAKSYDEYSDWRINQDSYFSIIEEAMTRDFDSMAEIPRDGIWAEFMQFLRDIWQKITGKTSEPTLKNYKDVFRLIRNSLKNSEKANADRLKNGGAVRMSKGLSALFPRQATIQDAYRAASQGQSSQYISLADVFAKAKEANPSLTEEAFKADVMRLYDSGAIYLEGANSQQEAEAASLSIPGTSVGTAVRIAIPQPMASKVFNAGLSSIPYEPQSGTTQVATTVGSYQKAANMLLSDKSPNIRVLDYGAGLGLGSDAMREEIANVDSFEVNPERWKGSQPPTFTDSSQIAEKYDGIVNLNVLNVVPKNIRDAIVDHIGSLLNDGGRAIIGVRKWSGDVDRASGEAGAEPKSIVIKKKQGDTFQKGFDGNELVDYLKERLGDGFLVVKANIAANGAIVTKLPSQAKASKVEYDSPNEAAFNSGAKYETNDTSVRPYASQGYGSQRMEGVSTGDNSPRAQAIRKAVSESNWNELSPTQRAKALEEFGLQSIQSRYSFDATLLPVRVTNERTPKNRPASILSAGPSPAITIQFDTSGLADLLSGDAVTAFANVFDIAQEEVIHAAQHINIYNRWKTSKSTDSVGLYELKHYTSMINEVAKIAGDELRSGNPAVANIFTNAWNLYNPNNRAADVNDAIGKIKSAPEAAAFAMELSRMMLQMQRQDFTTETGWMRFVEAMKAMLADITNALRTALAMAKNGQVGKRLQDEISEVNALINDLESASQPMASKVTYDSPNEAAFNSGAEVARNSDYDERDKAVRSTIRAAYDLAPKDNGPSVPLDQLFDIAKQSMTDLTEGEFSQILQDLYEDSGALLQAGESPFIVTTSDGQRAGSVIIVSLLPTGAMASTIDPENDATKKFVKDIQGIKSGTLKAAFGGRQFFDFEPVEYTVRSNKSYEQTAINYVNNFIAEGGTLEQMANSVIAPNFLAGIGIEDDVMARQALVAEVKNRVVNVGSKKKSKVEKKFFERLNQRISAFWQGVGSKGGRNQGQRAYIIGNPRYSWMFLTDEVDKELKKRRDNILNVQFGNDNATSFTQNSYENADMANQIAADDNINAAEESQEFDQDAADLAAGEATLTSTFLKLYEELKDLLREQGILSRLNAQENITAKASIAPARRNELAALSKDERAKLSEKNLKRIGEILNTLLGKEEDANTLEKKTVRKKREKMVEVAKKRADKGQPIDPAETANDIAIRLLNEFENKLAKSAFFNSATKPDTIVKAFREQISDPMDRKAFKDRLMAMEVTSEMADRLFDKAARTKDNAQWKRAQDMLEGPNALRNIIREINRARPGGQAPLSKQIPWRKLLSQKAKTVEEYRQRIFDAISANEELKSATPEQKARLADLFTEAWEANRTRILDGMQERLIREKEAKGELSKKGAEALQEQRMRMVEDINLGIFDNDEIAKIMAEKFGVKSEFTDAEREKIESLIEILQDEKLNRVKRNKAAYELLETLSAQTDIPISKLLANFWVSSVLSGMNTVFSIGMSVFSGMGELTTTLYRIFVSAFSNPKQLPSEVAAAFKTLARVLSAVPRQANRAWQYLVTGDQAFLDPTMNDALKNMDWDSIGKNTQLAEQMAKSDKTLQKVMGLFMRTVSRLLTALDLFNSGLTKEGSLSLVFRQLNLDPAKIEMLEKKSDLKAYKAQVIEKYFGNVAPKTAREKALVESYAMAEMMKALDELGSVSENADQMAMQGAMTLDPSGVGGYGYRLVKSMMKSAESGADKLVERNLRKWDEAKNTGETTEAGLKLALSYIFQFAAYNAANLVGVRFARFAGNKFNQSLSFLPIIGAFRLYEAEFDADRIRGKEAFTDMIKRNQLTGVMAAAIGYYVLKAIADEPDDEKRGWFINGGWSNLTPEKKQQKLASGQKEYTLGFGDTVINYGNWPGSGIIAAIGGLSDLIRFSPDQWSEKTVSNKLMSATASGVFSALEVPALSQFQELFGSSLSSKDPNEQKLTKFARVIGNYAGGFVPRILKDIDYAQDPNLRKYETLWEKIASHIPVYRRYEGKEYYDILGQQIQRNIYPGSREFMTKPTDPAYKVLGALHSRGIWLTPANAEHRMVGKGARRRSLTQEEADNYSLETGKGYKQMLMRYGQRALQMPTERAKAFLLDKADDVRDRALKKVYRGYTPAS